MTNQNQYYLLALNANLCPETDEPIAEQDCRECEFFEGFELKDGKKYVKCSALIQEAEADE